MQMLFFFIKRKSASTFCGIYFIVTLFSGDQCRSLKEAFACCLVQASELKEEIDVVSAQRQTQPSLGGW